MIYIENDININKKNIFKFLIKIVGVIVTCLLIANITASVISFYLGMLIYITLAMRIYVNENSGDKVLEVIKKIILYMIILIIYVFINRQLTGEIEKVMGSLITIYFSWDRILSISKDMGQLIVDKSVLYYYEEKNISLKELNKKYLDFVFIDKNIDEISLVIQILVRFNIINYKETIQNNDSNIKIELYELYKLYTDKKYSSYSLIVGYINICINGELLKKDLFFKEAEKLFKLMDNSYQKIFPLELVFEYIDVLSQNKEYEKIILLYEKYLHLYIKSLNKDILELLIEASNKTGNMELARDFEDVLKKFK